MAETRSTADLLRTQEEEQQPPQQQEQRFGMTPVVEEAYKSFWAALPVLMEQHPGQWVAYAGARQVGLGKTKTELYQRCLAQGLRRGEFIVLLVRPESDEQIG